MKRRRGAANTAGARRDISTVLTVETRTPYQLVSISYHVPSATEPGVIYTVTVTDDRWVCDCEASKWPKTRGCCWHLKAAKSGLYVGKPHVRARVLPPAPQPVPAAGEPERIWESLYA